MGPGMGAPSWAPPHLCRLLLPVGVFLLLLLHLTSLRLPGGLLPSACVWGARPCHWFGEMPPAKEDKEMLPPAPLPTAPLLPTPPVAPQWPDSKKFEINQLQSAFAACVTRNGQILIWEYLQGWNELIKLLDALGAAFRPISSEASGKIGVLQGLRAGRHGRHYGTLQAMVAFEGARGPPRGCRTLLRLHRALRWLQLFLRGLAEAEEGEAPARLCAEAYREALAPYHAWWVRRLAALAFLALPARPELYRLVCAGAGPAGARDSLRATARALERVYNVTQDVYAAHGLLDLP